MKCISTIKLKIPSNKHLVKTLSIYNKALQFCIDYAWKNRIRNNIKLHYKIYRVVKNKFKLQSQLVICCLKQACEIIKKAKSKPILKRKFARYNYGRSFSIKNNILSINTIKGRIKIPFTIPDYFIKYKDWKIVESMLVQDRKGKLFFNLAVAKDIDTKDCADTTILGVDVGINNIAVCSNNRFFNSRKVKMVKRRFNYIRGKLQAKGTRASKRLFKKISGRENKFMTWYNHNISKQIVDSIKGGTIVMEDLTNIREARLRKKQRTWLNNWSFYQLQKFIEYKASRKGIRVIKIDPRYTSQTCSRCHNIGSRQGAIFKCPYCFLHINSDLNASRNIMQKGMFLSAKANVTKPYLTCVDDEASSISDDDLSLSIVKSPRL